MGRGERNHMKKENNFLDLMGEIDEKFVSLENVFQSSKVFENGGPYVDLLNVSPLEI